MAFSSEVGQRMSEEGTGPGTHEQRPADDDRAGWRAYWQTLQQPWRTEPELDAERQGPLARRREITPSIREGAYPFGGMTLGRAEVEWLLATHEHGRGPVDWDDGAQRGRQGL